MPANNAEPELESLERIFQLVAEAPKYRQESLLAELCPDLELQGMVRGLLKADSSDGLVIDKALFSPPIEMKLGEQVGPYKLLQKIGEGGMGVVYMAEQLEPVRRRVAVKVIKPENDTKQFLARFEAERQALSLMEHPNIAKVLDAGATEAGRPYFVMELVKGKSITEYSAERKLSLRQILELFIPVCNAIQHAHHKGIIHRDLKPSNVLVTEYDGRPVAKVIDFGVAKALNGPLTNMTMFTGFGQFLGTVEYMSPEQSLLNQIDVDTRTDVYGLGALLYELITGSTPFDRVRLRSAAWDEMLKIIREEEPPAPSTRLSSGSQNEGDSRFQESGPSSYERQPQELSRLVRGELDWIVMTALEKDRSRRYATPGDMAGDIESYLSGDAVSACPPSIGYRLSKLARRNRFAVLTTVLVTASLLLGLVGTTWQAWQARRAEREAIAERKISDRQRIEAQALRETAENEAARVKVMNDFLRTDLLGLAGGSTLVQSDSDLDPNMTLATLLDRAKSRLDARFVGQSENKLQVQLLLVYAFCSIGKYEEASSLQEATIDQLKATRGVSDPDMLDKISVLAQLFVQQGRWRDARPLYEEAHKGRQIILGSSHPKTISSLNNLATTQKILGNYFEAAQLLAKCVELHAQAHGADDPDLGRVLAQLGHALGKLGRHTEAEQTLLRGVALVRKAPEHQSLDNALNGLGQFYLSLGRYEAAKEVLLEAFELREAQLDENSIPLIDTGLALGIAYQALEMFEEANRRLDEALGSLEDGHLSLASMMDNLELLASILREQGDEKRAEEVLQLSLSISEEQHFEDWRKPQTLSCLAEISMAQQQPGKAKEQLLEAYRILEEYNNEAEKGGRSATHAEAFDRVSRHVMRQIVAMSESFDDVSEAGDWQSTLDAIDSSVAPSSHSPSESFWHSK